MRMKSAVQIRVTLFIFLWILWNVSGSIITADDMVERIKTHGYSAEVHYIHTEDGYILAAHRIPNDRHSKNYRGALFLMHGLGSDSSQYILYKNQSAAYFFWNAGYDVWMGNARGNMFSRNHTTLDPDDMQFWKFSWHEIGYYDLPAMIDYAIKISKQPKLVLVGHSQGATVGMVMLSTRPKYNQLVESFHALGPPVILKYHHEKYPRELLTTITKEIGSIEPVVIRLRMYEVFSDIQRDGLQILLDLCLLPFYSQLCDPGLNSIFGSIKNHEYIKDIFTSSCSFWQIIHFIQISLSGSFRQYDHGPKENYRLYGTIKPPDYDLSNISTKVHILYGGNDNVIPTENISLLREKIGSNVTAVTEFKDFAHACFSFCQETYLPLPKIIKFIEKFN